MTSLFASTQNSLETTVPRPDMFDDFHIENATIFDVTTEFIETFVLQKPGDFCVSQTLKGQLFLSMLAESAKDGDRIVHLQVRAYDDGYGFRGMLFARGKTLGQLIFQLHENVIF
uniref:Uncharacterized protein n=1 Tax=Caenorhabditis japonica TaxID=281687 RepID=A0A8R1INX0_CAEJA